MDGDDPLTLRVRSLRQLRCASDHVRNTLIPNFTSTSRDLRSAYFDINSTYFQDDVFLGQMMLQSDLAYAFSPAKQDPYYVSSRDDFKKLRSERSNVGGFEVLHPRFLPLIADRAFNALQVSVQDTDATGLVSRLAVTDFFLQLAHVSKDGSGRSGEDFLSLLGHVHGKPLTFSLTGYRAILGDENHLLVYRHLTERLGQLELVRNFFLWLGFAPPVAPPIQIQDLLKYAGEMNGETRQSRQGWSPSASQLIDDILDPLKLRENEREHEFSSNHPYRLYALFLAAESTFLTLCLADPDQFYEELCSRYPLSMACRELDLQDACMQSYHTVPDGGAGLADEIVARLDLSRLNLAEGMETELDKDLSLLEKDDPYLASLIEGERTTAALEVLLSRAKVPLEPTMTALEVREAIRTQINWKR